MKTHSASSNEKTKVPIHIDRLLVGLRIPFDVYIRQGDDFERIFPKWTNFDETVRHGALLKGIKTVFIEGDAGVIAAYLGEDTDSVIDVETAEKHAAYAKKKKDYYQIEKTLLVDRHLFVPNSSIGFSLFEVDGMTIRLVLEAYPHAQMLIPSGGIRTKGDLAIRAEDIPLYQEYLNGLFQSPAIPSEVRKKTRAIGLKENSKILMRTVLADPHNASKTDDLVHAVGSLTDSVLNREIEIQDLMSLRNHDLYTYTHSVNVSVLSIALGAALGLAREQLEKLGIGAMMHDIGKSLIPPDVLEKQGQLTNEEFRLMRQHPIEGVKMLENNPGIPKESLVVVLQHHEKLSGRGYPLHLGKEKMTLFGRISSLVDSYDALTTPRPYRYAHTPYMALSLLTREATEQGDYDADCLKAFVKVVAEMNV